MDQLETTGDLEDRLGEAVVSLETCNEDKTKLREWVEDES